MTDEEFVEKVKALLAGFFEDAGEDSELKTNEEYYELLRELIG